MPEAVFPLASVAIKVTVFGPTLAQEKFPWPAPRLSVTVLQLSVVPPSISDGIILAAPLAFNETVIGLVTTVGGMVSLLVEITTVSELVAPLLSVTSSLIV